VTEALQGMKMRQQQPPVMVWGLLVVIVLGPFFYMLI